MVLGRVAEAAVSRRVAAWSVPTVWVEGCRRSSNRIEGGLGVDRQARQARMAALGHEQRELDTRLGEVGKARVTQLVERPSTTGSLEDLGRAAVREPGLS